MSRLRFRAAVETPRPLAAWWMVGTAAATLWVTGQLALWAMAAQAAAMGLALALRERPHPWQSHPVALNLGMLAIVACVIALALQGHPSTVALAHFAALAQGLQLLDARPRRSEFLLVTVALFQVLLAASLTDSVFLIPLLAGFVVATTWTLLVHTLRSEALEAGLSSALPQTLTRGLFGTTLIASAASIGIALVLFVVLPRMHGSWTAARSGSSAVSGFSDRVELGALGRIRRDRSVVLRVETLEGPTLDPRETYWRGLAFDHFDGRSWSVTPRRRRLVARNAELGVRFRGRADGPRLVQNIVREPVVSGVLFHAGELRSLYGPVRLVERDANGGLYAGSQAQQRVRYTASSRLKERDENELRRDQAVPPEDDRRFLALPPLDPAIHRLARDIAASQEHDADRARALEGYLVRTGRYTDTPPGYGTAPRSPVEAFLLGERAGHCEYFASAMVVLARALGLPARLVNGFAGGIPNPVGDFLEVRRSDAHAWVEIHYEKAGWVRYDPTPLDARLDTRASWLDTLVGVGSAIELWWFRRVVDFDRSDQVRALRAGWWVWRSARGAAVTEVERLRPGWIPPVRWLLGAGCAVIALAIGWGWWWRRAAPERIAPASRPYRQALAALRRIGAVREPAEPARAFARRVHGRLPEEAAAIFESLTEEYLAARFGRASPPSPERVRRLRRALRAGRKASRKS